MKKYKKSNIHIAGNNNSFEIIFSLNKGEKEILFEHDSVFIPHFRFDVGTCLGYDRPAYRGKIKKDIFFSYYE